MSPHAKKKAWSFTITGAAIVSAMAWGAPRAAPLVNQHWVLTDTFNVFQQAIARKMADDSSRRISDSLKANAAAREIQYHIDSTAGVLKACIRHPEECK